jgi:peptidoglycan/LPS O-acetylase OafA/YrhL
MGAFPRVFFAFFAGVLLFRLLRGGKARVANLPVFGALVALAALLVLGKPGAWHDTLMVIGVFPLLVALCARIQPTGRLAALCTWLGTTSYAVYVIHSPMLGWAMLVITHLNLDHVSVGLSVALRMLLVVVAAVVADRLWDIPVRQLLRSRPRVSTVAG